MFELNFLKVPLSVKVQILEYRDENNLVAVHYFFSVFNLISSQKVDFIRHYI